MHAPSLQNLYQEVLQILHNAFLHLTELLIAHVDMFFLEVHVAFLRDGDEVDVGMGHFQTDDGHANAFAGDSLLEGLGHFLGEDHHGPDFVVFKVEDVIVFAFGDHQGVTHGHGVDVHESEETLVLGNLIARDFALNDSREYGSHSRWFIG